MGADSQDGGDEGLAEALAAADDALARGDRRSSLDALRSAGNDDERRMQKKLACVRMLRKALPRRAADSSQRLSGLQSISNGEIPPPPDAIGRFEIRRELGCGAFGVVYLAFDPKLGRDVALKVPRYDLLLTPAVLGRFQTEARAAAGLDHPNIVQVFEAGELGSSFYIASAYCSGVSLDQWLQFRKMPVAVDWAVELLIPLADAVEHAHARGVLHRDLKPANILLVGQTPIRAERMSESAASIDVTIEAAPTPKITDFGLAKLDPVLGSPTGESWEQNYQTRSGAVIGTPAYMAPEQAGGDPQLIGPTADVYALGVVLYELLAGRPPFVGQSVFDTLHAVRNADPVPPSRLRAKLPRDIETICLRCLEKDPKRRYQSAKLLADDLRRFRSLQPIEARPASTTEHVVRWCRRNPQAAGLSAALVWVIILGFAGIFWQWRRAEAETVIAKDGETAALHARSAALAARDRADAEGRRAREAVEKMTAAGIELYKQQGQQEAGRKILEQAAAFHEGFVAERSEDPDVMTAACNAWNRLGWIREELGQRNAAISAMQRSVDLAEQLLQLDADDETRVMRRARSGQDYARILQFADRTKESLKEYAAADALWRKSCERAPEDEGRRLRLANSLLNHAVVLQGTDGAGAEKMYREALTLQRSNAEKHPSNLIYRREVALTTEALSLLAWRRGDAEKGEALGFEAEKILSELESRHPRDQQCRWYSARCRLTLGVRLFNAGRKVQAAELIRASHSSFEKLTVEFPRNLQFLEANISSCEAAGKAAESSGDGKRAEEIYRRGVQHFQKLRSTSPERAEASRVEAFRLHAALAALLAANGRLAESLEVSRSAIGLSTPSSK